MLTKGAQAADSYQDVSMNRTGMSGDSSPWEGWGHVREYVTEVPAGVA